MTIVCARARSLENGDVEQDVAEVIDGQEGRCANGKRDHQQDNNDDDAQFA